MASKAKPRCPECPCEIETRFQYCPSCGVNISDKAEITDLKGVEALITSPSVILSPSQMDNIYKVFQKHAASDPSTSHLLEDKLIDKYLQDLSQLNYTLKDMASIAQKMLRFRTLKYGKQY